MFTLQYEFNSIIIDITVVEEQLFEVVRSTNTLPVVECYGVKSEELEMLKLFHRVMEPLLRDHTFDVQVVQLVNTDVVQQPVQCNVLNGK